MSGLRFEDAAMVARGRAPSDRRASAYNAAHLIFERRIAHGRSEPAASHHDRRSLAPEGARDRLGAGSRTFARRVAEQPQQQAFFAALNAMSDGRVVPAPGGVLIREGAGGA